MLVTDMLMAILNCCSQEELEAEEEEALSPGVEDGEKVVVLWFYYLELLID